MNYINSMQYLYYPFWDLIKIRELQDLNKYTVIYRRRAGGRAKGELNPEVFLMCSY